MPTLENIIMNVTEDVHPDFRLILTFVPFDQFPLSIL